jgi:hypothetical protein
MVRPYQAPRSKHAGHAPRVRRQAPLLSRRAKLRWLAVIVVVAIVGATYYALSPGVASYQLVFVLILPLLFVLLFWFHRRIAIRLQWALAVALAVVGPVGYVIFGGSQWWAWGQLAGVPLVLLVIGRGVSRQPRGTRPEGWYGGPMQGPWGPP